MRVDPKSGADYGIGTLLSIQRGARPIQAADEAGGIGSGGLEDRLIVGHDTGPAGISHFSDKRGLAGTAWAYDQDHRRIRKGFLCPSLHKPRRSHVSLHGTGGSG
jgi:hypothetical protein